MTSSSLKPKPYFDIFPDELLVEILKRFPQNLVHRYKCVSKRWSAVTLIDDFIKCYIEYQTCLPHSKPPFALFYRYNYGFKTYPLRYAFSENPLFNLSGFSLNFLSDSSIVLLASSNGLFLVDSVSQNLYYVCNPLTKKWVTLPRLPSYYSIMDTGFVCTSPGSDCSFRIVHVLSTIRKAIKLVIYDSKSKEWTKKYLKKGSVFQHFFLCYGKAITCNMLLHWKNGTSTIFVYDPYNCQDSYKTIRVPNYESPRNIKSIIGVCKERLRYIEWSPENFRVWELEDYETKKWILIDEISMNQRETKNYALLATHPFDEEIVFLQGKNVVIWFNTRLKQLITISNMQDSAYSGILPITCFPVTLPLWPVTLPPHHSIG